MYCKWCGMDSKDDQRCEWCGRPFAAAAVPQSATTAMPGAEAVATQYPPRPETAPVQSPPSNSQPAVIPAYSYTPKPEDEAASPPQPNYVSSPPEATTAMQPAPPPVASDPRARAAQRAADYGDDEAPAILPYGLRVERYLGIMLPLTAIGMFVGHKYPGMYLLPFLLLLFPSGMLMGSFRVIGYYDDEFLGATTLLIASAMFGPIYGTAIYAVYGFIRQEFNYSLLGLMASFVLLLFAIGASAGGAEEVLYFMLQPRFSIDPISLSIQIFPLTLLLGGWMCASFTRPLNE